MPVVVMQPSGHTTISGARNGPNSHLCLSIMTLLFLNPVFGEYFRRTAEPGLLYLVYALIPDYEIVRSGFRRILVLALLKLCLSVYPSAYSSTHTPASACLPGNRP